MGCGGSKDSTKTANETAHENQANNNTNAAPNKTNTTTNRNSSPKRGPGAGQGAGGAGGGRSPKSKYATSSYNGSTQGEGFPEATDKGYNKRIRNNLVNATYGTDIDALEHAKQKFEKNRLDDCGDLTRANHKLEYLKLKKDLRDSINRNHVGVLERTIHTAQSSPYSEDLVLHIDAAERKLAHLRQLNEYSHDILAMDQSTISEIHTYHRPPACVHDVMAATYMLLGHNESKLRDWSNLQSMLGRVGRDSLIHQVREFDSSTVEPQTANRVQEILNYHELSEVRDASNGAATFHVWAQNVVDKIHKDNAAEEDRQRQEEELKQVEQSQSQHRGSIAKKR